MAELTIKYSAGPTAKLFHKDDTMVRGLMGPIGSGKSVSSVIELFLRAQRQAPYQGVRRTRWVVLRNTYPELKSTTIKTFQEWLPPQVCPFKWDSPITARMKQDLPDGTRMEMETMFISLDRPAEIKKLLSLEVTGAWMNEVREMSKATLDMLIGRTARYPSKRMGGQTWSGVVMDTNPPDDDHWYWNLAESDRPEGFKFFRQPPAILYDEDTGTWRGNPLAENVDNQALGYDYWLRQVHGKKREWIKVYLEGNYGTVEEGRPVYPEFNDALHIPRKDIKPIPDAPVLMAFDFGLTPAVTFMQRTPEGRLLVLDELSTPMDRTQGIRSFARDYVKPHFESEFSGLPMRITGDPAGVQRAQSDEKTCFQELRTVFKGVTIRPARSNAHLARREAGAFFLSNLIDGKPALFINPKCRMLRKAMSGGYKYNRVQIANDERFKDAPDKNKYSHIAEAYEYGCMHYRFADIPDKPRQEMAIAE